MASIKFVNNYWSCRRRKSRRESTKAEDMVFRRLKTVRYVQPKWPELTKLSTNEDNLFLSLRYFLIFGKILGVIPLQGLFQKDYKNVKRSRFWEVASLLVIAALLVNVAVGLNHIKMETTKSANDHAIKLGMFLFYVTGSWVYIHFYKHSSQLLALFDKWNNLRLYFTRNDVHLSRDVNLITFVVMTSTIGENLAVNFKHFPMGEDAEYVRDIFNRTAAEEYFRRSSGEWARLVPYNFVLIVFAFVTNKLTLYAWNYTDVTVMVLARTLYFKFQALSLQGEVLLFHDGAERLKWIQFVRDHETLRKLLKETNAFLSPMIFMSFGISTYFICMQLHNRLNPHENTTPIASIYALWSVFHLVGRILLLMFFCARINDWAHHVTYLLRRCPNKDYALEVERAETFMNSHTIGLSGLGCFTITKPLILKLVVVIFTFEVVLLQSLQASLNKSN